MIKLILAIKNKGIDIDTIYNDDVLEDDRDDDSEPQQMGDKKKICKFNDSLSSNYAGNSSNIYYLILSC